MSKSAKKYFYVVILFLLLVVGIAILRETIKTKTINWDKVPSPNAESCQFYPKLEEQIQCSEFPKEEYLISYGQKFCELFLKKRDIWIDPLKAWAIETSSCLQKIIVDNKAVIRTCFELKEAAFDFHPTCYKSAGFCSKLSPGNQLDILFAVFDSSILSELRRSITQGFNVVSSCLTTGPLEIVALSGLINDDLDAKLISVKSVKDIYNVEQLNQEARIEYATTSLAIYLFGENSTAARNAANSFAIGYVKKEDMYFDPKYTQGLSNSKIIECYFGGGGPGCPIHASRTDSPETRVMQKYSTKNKSEKLKAIEILKTSLSGSVKK